MFLKQLDFSMKTTKVFGVRRILATLGMFLCLSATATDLQLTLSWFGAIPSTNRAITLQSQSPFVGNQIWGASDSNGMCVFSNLANGLYNGVIKAPPAEIKFQVQLLTGDTGLIDASNRTAVGTISTYPAGATAWSIATSDQRYQMGSNAAALSFYPLGSNPSNYATLTDATNLTVAATNTTAIIRSDVFSATTNLLTTNLLTQIGSSNAVALLSATNLSTAERNALIASNLLIHADIAASNSATINTATNDAWQSFTNAALNGVFGFNLYSATNIPWAGITGTGYLPQWLGIGTNAYLVMVTNLEAAYLAAMNYLAATNFTASTNFWWTNGLSYFYPTSNPSQFVMQSQLNSTNTILLADIAAAQVAAQANSTNLVVGFSNAVTPQIIVLSNEFSAGTNAGAAYTDLKALASTNLTVSTSNVLAATASGGTNAVQSFVVLFYTPLLTWVGGTNYIWTNWIAGLNTSLLTSMTNFNLFDTNYANTNASSLAQGAFVSASNYSTGLFTNATTLASNGIVFASTVQSNATKAVGYFVTNLNAFVMAQLGRASIVVSGFNGGANVNGTDVWASATSWTNANGLSYITNDVNGSRIYSSGSPFYGAAYPAGVTWTNINGASPAGTTVFLPLVVSSGASGMATNASGTGSAVVTNDSRALIFTNPANIFAPLHAGYLTDAFSASIIFTNSTGGGYLHVTNSGGNWFLDTNVSTGGGGVTNAIANLGGYATNLIVMPSGSGNVALTISNNNAFDYVPKLVIQGLNPSINQIGYTAGRPGSNWDFGPSGSSVYGTGGSTNGADYVWFPQASGVTVSHPLYFYILGASSSAWSVGIAAQQGDFGTLHINGQDVLGLINAVSGPTNGVTAATVTNIVLSLVNTNGGGSATNAIANLNGNGTNTTIWMSLLTSNIISNPITLAGASNSLVNGSYQLDSNTNDAAYTNFPNGTISVPAGGYFTTVRVNQGGSGLAYMQLQTVFVQTSTATNYVSYPFGVWTNTVATNPCVVVYGGSGWPNQYEVVTNGGVNNGQSYYYSQTVGGVWLTQGETGPPTGTLYAVSTNSVSWPVMVNGRMNPLVFFFPITNNNTLSVYHGLGFEPSRVEWSLYCQHADPETFDQPGDTRDLFRLINQTEGAYYNEFHNSKIAALYFADYSVVDHVGQNNSFANAGETNSGCANLTNYLIRVRIFP